MQPIKHPINPPLQYPGGKYQFRKWIIPHLPPHTTYVEPFGGAAGILLNLPHGRKVYNDANPGLATLMQVIRDRGLDLQCWLMNHAPYKESTFKVMIHYFNRMVASAPWFGEPFYRAAREYIKHRMSFSGKGTCFRRTAHRNGWEFSLRNLPRVSAALQGVEITNEGWEECIRRWDSRKTVFFVDPPYRMESRNGDILYRDKVAGTVYEMSQEEHEALHWRLIRVKGKVLLAHYHDDDCYQVLYDNWDHDWGLRRVWMNNGTDTHTLKMEGLWANYELPGPRLRGGKIQR